MKKNKKGIVEAGVTVMTVIIAVVVTVSGALFTGGNPVGASLFVTGIAATAYTQTPHVKRKFRERKAIGMCEDAGTSNCTKTVKEWSDEKILDYIRDDEPGTAIQWSDMSPRLGSPKNMGGV